LVVGVFVKFFLGVFFNLARLLFPFDNFDEVTDLKKFYYQNYRLFFGSVGIQVILSMIDNMWLRKLPLSEQFPQIMIGTLMFAVVFFKIRNEWVHKILSILLSGFIVGGIAYNLDD
jgi:hypothetical protein